MDQTLLSTYRVLAEAHHIIDAAETLDEALRGVTRSLVTGFNADYAALWYVDAREGTQTLRPTFWVGNCDITDRTHTAGDGSEVGAALASGRSEMAVGASASLAIPIESDVALLGILEITREGSVPFTAEQVDVAAMCMMLAPLAHDLDQIPEMLWVASDSIMRVRDVRRTFESGDVAVQVLKGVELDVYRGEFLVLLGESGCGKSTLLNIMGGLDEPTSGSVRFEGTEHAGMDDRELTRYRREKTAFVFQSYNLVPVLTARQNLTLISEFCRDPMDADEALALVGLTERAKMRPSQLSGGQQQRVSIARALCKNPEVIFADEPTAALDYETSIEVLEAFERIVERGCTLVMVTHNEEICKMANRVMRLRAGRVAEVVVNRVPARARDLKW